jgi:hypothetical protein
MACGSGRTFRSHRKHGSSVHVLFRPSRRARFNQPPHGHHWQQHPPRRLVPGPPVQDPPGGFLVPPAPLFEEEGRAGGLALVANGPHPGRLHRPGGPASSSAFRPCSELPFLVASVLSTVDGIGAGPERGGTEEGPAGRLPPVSPTCSFPSMKAQLEDPARKFVRGGESRKDRGLDLGTRTAPCSAATGRSGTSSRKVGATDRSCTR